MSGNQYGDTGRPVHTTTVGTTSTTTPVYTTTTTPVTTSTSHAHDRGHEVGVQAISRDRVRWGPVLAGLFAAMSTLALLSVLGLAIGASSVDGNDSARAFGIGAGIWAIVTGIVAFAIGGYVAAFTAATPASHVDRDGTLHDTNALLQGAMVWMVAIPISVYLVAGGIGSALGMAGRTAGVAAQTAATAGAPSMGAAAQDQINRNGGTSNAADDATDKLAATTQQASGAVDNAMNQAKQYATPQNAERAADGVAKGAWGTLISMVVGLAAASVGGLVGGKSRRAVVRA